ncbi:unnamed protein product [Arabidopsis halleri]
MHLQGRRWAGKIKVTFNSVKGMAYKGSFHFYSLLQLESVKLFVGLPLDTVSDCNNVNHLKAITAGLKALKLLGVEGIELPIFWGVVEKEAAGKYKWSRYLAVAETHHRTLRIIGLT